ncbi:glucuronate isomerase [Paenibacillus solisilvae]|uniref:Glucuronate isomerase n=1 Tax=Paenibacillus solisilvae TaxID=2486751 RepID=A0ABW0VUR5_9BACL
MSANQAQLHNQGISSQSGLEAVIRRMTTEARVIDMHTHLYAEAFSEHLLWGIDELLHYHYLTAEFFRHTDLTYDEYWSLDSASRAEAVWQTLFVDRSPISEAASGVLTALNRLGLSPAQYGRDLNAYRAAFAAKSASQQVSDVLEAAKVQRIVMTNDPFDSKERTVWQSGSGKSDPRFDAALRIDKLLLDWPAAAHDLRGQGYAVEDDASAPATLQEVKRFLQDWAVRMDALYIMVSLPGDARYAAGDASHTLTVLLDGAVIPVCLKLGLPLALMIGVRRQVNPLLKLAGDMSMRSDLSLLEGIAKRYTNLELLITVLARENQHELAVLSRKFRNITLFGCWWFLHTESMIRELTEFRVELLGTSFIPQHSDCRVLEQLINKWEYSRGILADILIHKYGRLLKDGWELTEADISRDVEAYFGGTFLRVLENAKRNRIAAP